MYLTKSLKFCSSYVVPPNCFAHGQVYHGSRLYNNIRVFLMANFDD